jgi:hypothetical protein
MITSLEDAIVERWHARKILRITTLRHCVRYLMMPESLSPGAKVQPNLSTLRSRWIQHGLEFDVEGACADTAPVHRAEHLDITDRIEAEAARDGSTRPASTSCGDFSSEGFMVASAARPGA